MQTIDPEIIYELTPEGHDVLQHRSLQLPMELRFLLMLINGSRNVGTLRVVTPAAKYDDAGFIILQEYGLICATNSSENETLQEQAQAIEGQLTNTSIEQANIDGPGAEIEEAIINSSISSNSWSDHTSDENITQILEHEVLMDNTCEEDKLIASNVSRNESNTIELGQKSLSVNVSIQDRTAVESILKRALKQDAKFVIDQLAEKHTYADFLPAIKRLETAIRGTVSTIEADVLRNRFSEAFS